MSELFDNTICAPATPSGGAVSIVRVSGKSSVTIVDKVFRGRTPLYSAKGYTLHYGEILDQAGSVLDQVVVLIFRSPLSYTGEDSVEISCHGSPYIVQTLLSLLIENGAKMADPGEFTQRAFVNGKLDLSQAEAVADVIASQTAAAHRIAFRQLKGGFRDELSAMREEMLHIVSLMELELDFSEEDVEFADRTQLKDLLDKVNTHIERLISSFRLGNVIKNGVPVAIVGAANSGKSTLLNAILGENRAIVSDIAGTTRDTIEECLNVEGVLFRFIDTAGLRESNDTIEKIGIDRAYTKISEASLVLVMIDLTSPVNISSAIIDEVISRLNSDQKAIFLLNKSDLISDDSEIIGYWRSYLRSFDTSSPIHTAETTNVSIHQHPCEIFRISAKDRIGIDALLSHISSLYKTLEVSSETTLVTNERHLQALQSALSSLIRVRSGLDTMIPTDLLTQDLREALYHLGSITGEITTDEILGNIFRKFCIGK